MTPIITAWSLSSALAMDPAAFKAAYGIDKPDLDHKNIIVYCQSGNRSRGAHRTMLSAGYKHALNYAGSYGDWSWRESARKGSK